MLCPRCNTKLPDNANFCSHCGRPLRSSPAISEDQYQKLVAGFEDTIQILPDSTIVEDVESASGSGSYTVNLAVESCTCPDWRNRRPQYPVGHLRRPCKHVVMLMLCYGKHTAFERAILAHIHFGIKPTEHFVHFSTPRNPHIFAVRHQDREWCDVIALMESSNDFDRLGYNFEQRRWAYGEEPIDHADVEAKLLDWRSVANSSFGATP